MQYQGIEFIQDRGKLCRTNRWDGFNFRYDGNDAKNIGDREFSPHS
jgi:hypothetical protein